MNWQMIDGYGGNVQVTLRATWAAEWPEIMRVRKQFCEKAQEAGWTFPGTVKPTAAAPGFGTPAGSPVPMPSAPMAASPTNGNGVLSLKTTSLKVIPRPDGKVDLEFWNPGRQYAELKAVKEPAAAAAMLSATGAWTPAHFAKPDTFPLAVNIEYVLGKPNSKGTPYKDIMKIELA